MYAIESQNVVGYTGADTKSLNNFETIPFALVGYNTSDIQQLKISDAGLGMIGWGGELFSIWEGVPTVAEGSEFYYYDPSMDPNMEATEYYWGDAVGNKTPFSIALGQGIVLNCAEGLTVTTAGQVPTEDIPFTSIAGNNFTGNPFPAQIDIQAISIDDGGLGMVGWGGELFSIWEGVPTVAEGSEFYYYDPSMDPNMEATEYYWGDAVGVKAKYPIPSGKGCVINCAAGLTIKIAAPYTL